VSEFTPDQILPLSRNATRRPSEYRTIDALCRRLGVVVTEPYAPADEIMHRLLDRIEALERALEAADA
jgi:hypothetical protein